MSFVYRLYSDNEVRCSKGFACSVLDDDSVPLTNERRALWVRTLRSVLTSRRVCSPGSWTIRLTLPGCVAVVWYSPLFKMGRAPGCSHGPAQTHAHTVARASNEGMASLPGGRVLGIRRISKIPDWRRLHDQG